MINESFWKGKRVLITGHTGFKGGWLSIWIKNLGAQVIGYSLNPITKKNFFDQTKIKKIFKKDYRKNIQNINDLEKCISTYKPQIIFHLAAQPQVLESYIKPLDTVRTNSELESNNAFSTASASLESYAPHNWECLQKFFYIIHKQLFTNRSAQIGLHKQLLTNRF